MIPYNRERLYRHHAQDADAAAVAEIAEGSAKGRVIETGSNKHDT